MGTLSQAWFIAVGDINNDGYRDIAASSADQNKRGLVQNNGGAVHGRCPSRSCRTSTRAR
ncbi:MAG: FG-GAP repeat protein [Desulfobacterales bacterium]|nr:FG-GAP repeat protein [Desulfobacterales bacterium]